MGETPASIVSVDPAAAVPVAWELWWAEASRTVPGGAGPSWASAWMLKTVHGACGAWIELPNNLCHRPVLLSQTKEKPTRRAGSSLLYFPCRESHSSDGA
jgi:hypothetical protein